MKKYYQALKQVLTSYQFWALIAFVLFLKGSYLALQKLVPWGSSIATALDEVVPFVSFFVLFYVLYYPFILSPLLFNMKNKKVFFMTLWTMVLISVCSFLTYALFQTEIARPDIVIYTVFDKLVGFVYSLDKPLNLFPSLHVSLTTAAFLSLRRTNRKISPYIFPFALGIILSTVFIKQHYVLDVFAGLVLGGLSYLLVFHFSKIKRTFSSLPQYLAILLKMK